MLRSRMRRGTFRSSVTTLALIALVLIQASGAGSAPPKPQEYGTGASERSARVAHGPSAEGAAAAIPVPNGDFETGDFTGWTTVDAGDGQWSVYSGTVLPISGNTVEAPPQGTFAAMTDMNGPGSHILYQDLVLPAGQGHHLNFILYYDNRSAAFFTPDSLDHTGAQNQQYRVDLIDPSAPVDSVAPSDVLLNIFRTEVGDPLLLAPTPMSVDLTPFAGQTVRLRFAEVDNQLFLHAGVDAVEVQSGACKGQPVTIFGTEGDDEISGTPGDDVILGLGGDDVIRGFGGDDLICAGDGNDLVRAGTHQDRVFGEGGNDKLLGQGGSDNLKGGSGRDRLKGGGGSDKANGQSGRDSVLGQGGSDKVRGGGGRDKVKGGAGDDVVAGQGGPDILRGNGGDDTVRGQGGNDKLLGNSGDDKLVGGPGTDECNGGGGVDTLVGCEA